MLKEFLQSYLGGATSPPTPLNQSQLQAGTGDNKDLLVVAVVGLVIVIALVWALKK